jgi:hypothetical protein
VVVSASENVASIPASGAVRSLVGIWRLVSAKATDENGNPANPPYGPRGIGIVALSADGRMTNVLVDGRAALPEGAKREHNSYCGTYTFDGSTLVTTVDAAADPARMGTEQVRKVRFEGERMVLQPPVLEVDGVKVTRELTWEKISPISL